MHDAIYTAIIFSVYSNFGYRHIFTCRSCPFSAIPASVYDLFLLLDPDSLGWESEADVCTTALHYNLSLTQIMTWHDITSLNQNQGNWWSSRYGYTYECCISDVGFAVITPHTKALKPPNGTKWLPNDSLTPSVRQEAINCHQCLHAYHD